MPADEGNVEAALRMLERVAEGASEELFPEEAATILAALRSRGSSDADERLAKIVADGEKLARDDDRNFEERGSSDTEEAVDAGTGRDSLGRRTERTKPETIGGSLSERGSSDTRLTEALRQIADLSFAAVEDSLPGISHSYDFVLEQWAIERGKIAVAALAAARAEKP